MIRYTISYSNALNHIIDITMSFELDSAGSADILLSTWRPGRYELADFAKNVLSVSAQGSVDGHLCVKKISKSGWRIDSPSKQTIIVSYKYYAFKMDAGSSWLHDDQLYVNPVNCLMYLPGRLQETTELTLRLPESYEVACSLDKEGNHLKAENFYQLADSPFIASPPLTHLSYNVSGIEFHIWQQGKSDVQPEKMIGDFKKFTEQQLSLFGDLPLSSYHFLLQCRPYPAYHGVEHTDSTVLTLGPCSGDHTDQFYERLLGISSHELFHAWNITRIRPKELLPYDFSKETYFETGYVAEGFTTYYGDLMLVRSGVYEEAWYLNELNALLIRHFQNFGRFNQSVAASSFDLWLDGYQPGTPNRKVSIYVKGAIVALLLDLTIRLATNSEKSLDDVMRVLWSDYFKEGKGYSKEDICKVADQLAGKSLGSFFDKYIEGNMLVETELAELADKFGLTLYKRLPESLYEKTFGFKIKLDNDRLVVAHVHPASCAYLLLSVDDEIVQVNGETERDKILTAFSTTTTMTIKRHAITYDVELAEDGEFYETYALQRKEDIKMDESIALNKWLHR